MSRLTWVVAVLAVSGSAYAESQSEIAAKLNEDGKEAMFANNFVAASAKFREAVARVPEPKYFFNLCTSLYQEGKFSEALTACSAVGNNNPSQAQRDKADKLTTRINEEAKAQGLVLMPAGGGGGDPNVAQPDPNNPNPQPDPNNPNPDPNNPNPNNPNPNNPNPNNPQPPMAQQPVVGKPPTMGLFTGTKPDNNYTWTLGVDLYGGGGVMGGKAGDQNVYGTAVGGARIKGDYLLNAAARFGAQGYVQVSHVGQGEGDAMGSHSLDVVDFGVAAYKHICLQGAENVCITPLLGGHLAMMSPQGETTIADDGTTTQLFNYVAAGIRAEINLAVAFGTRQEHVLNVALGANAYSQVFSGPTYDPKGEGYYLDSPGSFGYLGVGYTYRFNTPFGSSPFITLE